jgi:hypothetical protein
MVGFAGSWQVWGISKCHHNHVAEPSYDTKEMQVRGEPSHHHLGSQKSIIDRAQAWGGVPGTVCVYWNDDTAFSK